MTSWRAAWARRRSAAGDDLIEIHGGQVQIGHAGFDAGEVQELGDHLAHAFDFDLDAVEEFGAGGGVVGGAVLQGFDEGAEGGEGRAQLVGDVGDEVAADGFGLAEVGEIAEEDQALAQAGDPKGDGDGVDFALGGADGQEAGGGLFAVDVGARMNSTKSLSRRASASEAWPSIRARTSSMSAAA